jgi:hypothetical protein
MRVDQSILEATIKIPAAKTETTIQSATQSVTGVLYRILRVRDVALRIAAAMWAMVPIAPITATQNVVESMEGEIQSLWQIRQDV